MRYDEGAAAASVTAPSTATETAQRNQTFYATTGRPPIPLYVSCDPDDLSAYQVLVRKSIVLFETTASQVHVGTQGRNKPIVLGQVGIRCVYCTALPPDQRARASVYYPAKLVGIYQAAQSLATSHLLNACREIPESVRHELLRLRDAATRSSSATAKSGGKTVWAERAQFLGVFEDDCGLRFAPRIDWRLSQPDVPTDGECRSAQGG